MQDLQSRTRRFAVDILRFCSTLPSPEAYRIIARQLGRAGTSVGANYRAACRGKSKKDFIAKLGIVEEEADESRYWLEVLREIDEEQQIGRDDLELLYAEAGEILAITVASIRTARRSN